MNGIIRAQSETNGKLRPIIISISDLLLSLAELQLVQCSVFACFAFTEKFWRCKCFWSILFFCMSFAAPHSLFISYSRKFPSRLSWMFYFHVYWSYLLSEWSVLLVRTSSKMMRTELKNAPIEIMHKNTMCQVNYHRNVPVFTRI